MPLCQGRSDWAGVALPCPNSRCDSTVRGRQGDLLMCDSCCEYRFPTAVRGAGTNVHVCDTDNDNDALHVDRFVRSEMLHFVQNKCDILAVDKLAAICSNFYDNCEVDTARNLLGAVYPNTLEEAMLSAVNALLPI